MMVKSIDDKIQKAFEFVLSNRNDDGMWYNFLTRNHGESADWVSSFIGLNLLDSGIEQKELKATAQSILKRQRNNGGFSYNHKIVPDADSTAFAIRFLSHFGYETEIDMAKNFLKEHQHINGGFRTYQEQSIRKYERILSEMSVEGWCSPTPDITASALLANLNNEFAIQFLLNTQQENGSWRSYWWTSDVYATTHSLEALSKLGYNNQVEKANEWLAQDNNVPDVAFYLSLSIRTLVRNKKYRGITKSRIERLLSSQNEDGSWDTIPILQFPLPSNSQPWYDSKRWREDARDQNKIFTTSSCIKALSEYRRNTLYVD